MPGLMDTIILIICSFQIKCIKVTSLARINNLISNYIISLPVTIAFCLQQNAMAWDLWENWISPTQSPFHKAAHHLRSSVADTSGCPLMLCSRRLECPCYGSLHNLKCSLVTERESSSFKIALPVSSRASSLSLWWASCGLLCLAWRYFKVLCCF